MGNSLASDAEAQAAAAAASTEEDKEEDQGSSSSDSGSGSDSSSDDSSSGDSSDSDSDKSDDETKPPGDTQADGEEDETGADGEAEDTQGDSGTGNATKEETEDDFHPLDPDGKLKKLFDTMDSDGGGSINTEELAIGIHKPSPDEIKEFVRSIDVGGDGSINWQEFLSGFQRLNPHYKNSKFVPFIRALFDKYDDDGSEALDGEELIAAAQDLLQVNPLLKKKLVNLFDAGDGDGQIDYEEFITTVDRLQQDILVVWACERMHAQKSYKKDRRFRRKRTTA